MARQLWLLRHGEAEPHDARGADGDRRLTERGEAQARSAGRALAALEVRFQVVYASPKVRARDTARLAAEALGVEPVSHEPLAAGLDAAEARALVGEDERVLIVGHDPDLSQVVLDLTGARVALRKGGLAALDLDGSRGRLLALLRPRELSRMS